MSGFIAPGQLNTEAALVFDGLYSSLDEITEVRRLKGVFQVIYGGISMPYYPKAAAKRPYFGLTEDSRRLPRIRADLVITAARGETQIFTASLINPSDACTGKSVAFGRPVSINSDFGAGMHVSEEFKGLHVAADPAGRLEMLAQDVESGNTVALDVTPADARLFAETCVQATWHTLTEPVISRPEPHI